MEYSAEDADMTFRLYKQQKKDLPRKRMAAVYETLERPLIEVLVEMEHTGIKVDPIILKKMSEDFSQRLQSQAVTFIDWPVVNLISRPPSN